MNQTEASGFGDMTGIGLFIVDLVSETAWYFPAKIFTVSQGARSYS
jgi:hypothetical protein